MALTSLGVILDQLGGAVQQVTYGNTGPTAAIGQPGTLWLWEAYVTGGYKTATSLPGKGRERWLRKEANRSTRIDASSVGSNIADAFRAVRYGFANSPAPINRQRQTTTHTYQDIPPQVVPVIGPVVQDACRLTPSVRGLKWWNDPCLVIAPMPQSAHLLWP